MDALNSWLEGKAPASEAEAAIRRKKLLQLGIGAFVADRYVLNKTH
jgi:hypothetical protein